MGAPVSTTVLHTVARTSGDVSTRAMRPLANPARRVKRGKGEREQSIEHDAVICQPSESKEYVRTTKLLF